MTKGKVTNLTKNSMFNASKMPMCRDNCLHRTQEEADACLKHPDDKDFDRLSTISRIQKRQRTASPSSTTSAGSARRTAPVLPAPDAGPQMDDRNDGPIPPPQPTPEPAGEAQRPSVQDWINNVGSDQNSGEHGFPGNGGDNVAHTQQGDGKTAPNASASLSYNRSHDARTAQDPRDEGYLPTPATSPLGAQRAQEPRPPPPFGDRKGELVETRRVDVTSVQDYRPWYTHATARGTCRALAWAALCAVLLSVLVLNLASRDAERYP